MNLDRIIAVRNRKTVYRDGDLCMKVFDASYSKADILAEALNQARAEEIGLHVPPIRKVTVIDGKWTIITDYIKGKSMAQLISEHPEQKNDLLERFVKLQLEVQSASCPLLPDLRQKMYRKIAQSDLDDATRNSLYALLDSMPGHDKLCHGDFNPSNIILAQDGTPYILDWAHAAQGNASADAARTYLLFWLDGDIDAAERYLRLFCLGSGTDRQYVRKWMPIVAAARLLNGNEKEREFLRSWIRIPDNESTNENHNIQKGETQ